VFAGRKMVCWILFDKRVSQTYFQHHHKTKQKKTQKAKKTKKDVFLIDNFGSSIFSGEKYTYRHKKKS
jgi:hypothetical protein